MKIDALFTDYDGTLAPSDVKRDKSKVPLKIARRLRALSSKIPIAIITSKDCSFVRPRTQFASAWACCSGLEIILRSGESFGKKHLPELTDFVIRARRILPENVFIEEKRSTDGQLVGVCIDWASADLSIDVKNRLIGVIRREDAYLDHSSSQFLDVYAARPDKGVALTELKRILGVKGKVLYLGDSLPDNAAFEQSDVALGVDHGQLVDQLKCKYLVPFNSIDAFFGLLLEKNLEFSPGIVQYVGGRQRAC